MTAPVISPKKLIEVALPLDAINVAAAASKRKAPKGYPTTLHTWWAQRPLAAARAVVFSQLVHDPEDLWRCQNPGKEPSDQQRGGFTQGRNHLFKIIEDLVLWKNTTNEAVLDKARAAIRKSWQQTCELNKNHPNAKELFNPDKMPGLHDPFAGGGAIPLEAQRLGLEAHASDLNPVAVLINKAMIEIPPKFAGRPPVSELASRHRKVAVSDKKGRQPELPGTEGNWRGAAGLAADVRFYGAWMRDEAFNRIGHLYPPAEVTAEMAKGRPDLKPYVGEKLTVIAWLWARTVKSPNPAFCGVDVPLANSFILSIKEGKNVYVKPVVSGDNYRFTVGVGNPLPGAELGTRAGKAQDFRCLMSQVVVSREYVREEGRVGRIGTRLMAIVAEGKRGRVYLDPSKEHSAIAESAATSARVEEARSTFLSGETPTRAMITGGVCSAYGLTTWGHLFTARQLVGLTTFSDLVGEVRGRVKADALAAGMPDEGRGLDAGGTGATAYAEAVSVYLTFALSRIADYGCELATWRPKDNAMRSLFSKQALQMSWDFAEGSPFAKSSSGFNESVKVVTDVLPFLPAAELGVTRQADAQTQTLTSKKFVSTDPPYYDNIGYADLSDFFYVWLRQTLRPILPNLFATISAPKTEELVATPYRHGSKENAEKFFLDGMTQAMHNLAVQAHPAAPITIYYSFKQSETEKDGTNSTGWETFLEAVLKSGFAITGTWPMRTEGDNRSVGIGTNALASSIILVCRQRLATAGSASRRQFVRELNAALPFALSAMTRKDEGEHSPVAPVDLSQAIIGPGMAIFSKYAAVLEADGTPMSVKTALQLINKFLTEGDFDADTQFCLHWFEQHGWEAGQFGSADVLARAKGTTVDGAKAAGVVVAGGGSVRLLRWKEYPADWDPATDKRLPVWEALHHLIRLHRTEGETAAGRVYAGVAGKAEAARQLAYRLHTLCERKGWSDDARAYNEVVTGWAGIETAAAKVPPPPKPKGTPDFPLEGDE